MFANVALVLLFSSAEEEQAATDASAVIASTMHGEANLTGTCRNHQIGPVPPAATQRLEQRRGIGEPVRLRLNQAKSRLLVCLVRIKHRKIGSVAVLILEPREVETRLGGFCRGSRGLKGLRIVLQCSKRVGDILEGREHGAPILFGGLLVCCAGPPLLMQPSPAVEDGREQ